MKFNFKGVLSPITGAVAKGVFTVKKASPEICLGLGIVAGVACCVTACKATLKADDILDKHAEAKAKIKEAEELASVENAEVIYTEADKRRDIAIAYRDTAIGFIKLYGPSVALGVVSIAFILSSYGIMKKRNLALISAYTALDEGFKKYRKGVIEKYGEDADLELRGIKKVKGLVKEIDEEGNEKEVEKEVQIADEAQMEDVSNYDRIFSKFTSPYLYQEGDQTYNKVFLTQLENGFNDQLTTKGYVFLSDVYKALGFPETPESRVVGWIKDPAGTWGDGYISFGIRDIFKESGETIKKSGRIVKNYSGTEYYLTFNVDGYILNLFDRPNKKTA